MLRLKKSYNEFENEKYSYGSKIPLPHPHNWVRPNQISSVWA